MKINVVNLLGYVPGSSLVTISNDSQFRNVVFMLRTARFTSADEQLRLKGFLQLDSVPIFTSDSKVYEKFLKEIGQGDIVSLLGTLVTKNIVKRIRCPHCGLIHEKPFATNVYVEPECATIVGHVESESKGEEYIKKNAIQSNQIMISGVICKRKPEVYKAGKTPVFDFQIASNRLRHAKGFDPDSQTDYPWVRAYGEKTEEYAMALDVGSEIVITGAIEARKIQPMITCEHCQKPFTRSVAEPAVEIVPYSIDYGKNCTIPRKEEAIEVLEE